MGPGYSLITLEETVTKNDTEFPFLIQRNFDTELEPAGAPVFYFFEKEEAQECLDTLISQ